MPKASLPLNEADRLIALRSYRILDTACEETFDNLAHLAARITGCPTALVCLVDADRQWFKGRHGTAATETHRDMAFCAHTILDAANPLIVDDATADARFQDNLLVTGDHGIRFYAGMPLVNPQGYALGSLCVIDYTPRHISPADLEMLKYLAQAVMSALELRKAASLARAVSEKTAYRLAELIEALPNALVLTASDGRIHLVNRGTERLFGYKRSELQGQLLEVLVPERCRRIHVALRQDFMNDMSSRLMGTGKALFGLRNDGSEFPLEIALNPIDFDEERMTLAVVVDIGERYKIEAERQRRSQELAQSNADLQDFAYAASHDMRAPLRAIAHLADWIREDIDPAAKPEMIENLDLLQGRVARLGMLLDGMLAYSRAGSTDAATTAIDIAELVRDIISLMDLPPGFAVVCDGPMAVIRTHASPIQTVLKNLISNGLQHHDRAEGCVTVSMRVVDDMAEFRVSDDGPGIPLKFHERIFLIFQTLQSRDDKESSGIGLAIVKKAVEDHGGQIRVESNPPARGATFVFSWRIAPDERQDSDHTAG